MGATPSCMKKRKEGEKNNILVDTFLLGGVVDIPLS